MLDKIKLFYNHNQDWLSGLVVVLSIMILAYLGGEYATQF